MTQTDLQITFGNESAIADVPLMGDAGLRVRSLMPDGPAYDFAVNTMTYDPGAALSMVEIHVMEHGLLMLEGGGIYRLGDAWYPVEAGDFIWMAPYCPQWFGAIGKKPAKYLIYKDWRRHPLRSVTDDHSLLSIDGVIAELRDAGADLRSRAAGGDARGLQRGRPARARLCESHCAPMPAS